MGLFDLNNLKSMFAAQVTAGITNQDEMDVITPYVTGHAYLVWTRLPRDIVPAGFAEVTRVLASQVQIPGYTLSTTEGNYGFSGTGKTIAPTSIECDNSITVTYQEQINLPVLKALKEWVFGIRDPNSGLSRVKNYSLRNISGDLLVIFTKPILYSADNLDNIIEHCALYTHVIPTTVPFEVLNSNKESSEKVAIDEVFKFKSCVMNEQVTALAMSKLGWAMKNSSHETVGIDLALNFSL